MVAPLSAKLNQKMQLDRSKALADEKRKQELQEIKLQDAEAKANLGILFSTRKEIIDEAIKLANAGIKSPVPPLPAVPQASGSMDTPTNPEAGPSDTVVTKLTPGEAVIPANSAQDPKNKAVIAQLVDEGRQAQGYKRGTVSIPKPTKGLTGTTQQENMLPIIPVIGRRKKMQGYSMGSIDIGGIGDGIGELFDAGKKKLKEYLGPAADDGGWVTAPPSVTKQGPLTVAERNQNPGNLVYAGQRNAVRGEPKAGGGNWAGFQSYEDGRAALENDIRSKTQRQGLSLGDTINKYAPPRENDTGRYQDVVSSAIGVPTDSKVPLEKIPALADAITRHEGGYSNAVPTTQQPAKPKGPFAGSSFGVPLSKSPSFFGTGQQQITPQELAKPNPTPPPVITTLDEYNRQKQARNPNWVPPPQIDVLARDAQVPPVQEQQGPQEQDPAFQSPEATEKWFSEMTKNNFPALQAAQAKALAIKEKGGDGEGFFQGVLKNIYGRPDSLVNPQTVARFIMGTSFGALSGGSLGGSIKWAAQDTLRNYDQLHQQEASDNRVINAQIAQDMRAEASSDRKDRSTMAKFYREQGYDEANIQKFLKSNDTKDLGNRAVNLQWDGSTRLVTPNNGEGAGQPLTVKTYTDKFSGNKVDMVNVGGKQVPLDKYTEFLNRGNKGTPLVLVPHNDSTSEAGRLKHYENFGDKVAENIAGRYKSVEHLQGKEVNTDLLPGKSRVAQEVTKYANERGIRMTDVGTQLEMQGVANNAIDDMMREHRANPKTQINSIIPFLENARMKSKVGGLSEDLFYDNKAKLMPITKRMSMYEQVAAAAKKTEGKETPEDILQKLAVAWNKPENLKARQRYIASDNNSAFYNYVMEMTKTK